MRGPVALARRLHRNGLPEPGSRRPDLGRPPAVAAAAGTAPLRGQLWSHLRPTARRRLPAVLRPGCQTRTPWQADSAPPWRRSRPGQSGGAVTQGPSPSRRIARSFHPSPASRRPPPAARRCLCWRRGALGPQQRSRATRPTPGARGRGPCPNLLLLDSRGASLDRAGRRQLQRPASAPPSCFHAGGRRRVDFGS